MIHISDPVTALALMILVSVVIGTFLLITAAFIRRWQQIRYARYVHNLQCEYRPVLAKILSGVRSPSSIEALRELSLPDIDLLLDPLFSRRKLTERQRVFLQALCSELGLIAMWQARTANGRVLAASPSGDATAIISDRPAMRHLLRAKSIRNLGILHHHPSWAFLAKSLDDNHADIQLVALRSLAELGAVEGFHVLRERIHAVVLGEASSPPVPSLLAAMASFDLTCAPDLLPSLSHSNRQIRLHTTEVLRMMVCREAVRQPHFNLTEELITPPMVEVLVTGLAVDVSAEIRARAAEVLVYLSDQRAPHALHNLLLDSQWFVRLRTLRAVAHLRHAVPPLNLDIRNFLGDPHWQMREAAIQALISLGYEERLELYEFYLSTPDRSVRQQIAEVIQRSGLMSELVEEYSTGVKGVNALMMEELASHVAPTGLSGVLRNLDLEMRQKFLERFLPIAQSRMALSDNARLKLGISSNLQEALEFPPKLAA